MSELPTSMKAPPTYREGNSYDEYKRDLEVWKLLKVATAEEQGLLVYRTLVGRAKAACNDLDPESELNSKDGLKLIIKRLDKIFIGDDNHRIYKDLDSFEKYRRKAGILMTDFILEFENLHNKVKSHKITYPDGILAYRLIKAANLTTHHEELLKATVETGNWTYDCVVNQLQKIFNEIPSSCQQLSAVKVENEAYHACSSYIPYIPTADSELDHIANQDYEVENPYDLMPDSYPCQEEYDIYFNQKPRFRYPPRPMNPNNKYFQRRQNVPPSRFPPNRFQRQPFYPEARPPTSGEYRSLKAQYNSDPNVANPKDSQGNYTICRRCRSVYHWIGDCPHNTTVLEKQTPSNTYFTNNNSSDSQSAPNASPCKSLEDQIHIALLQSCDPTTPDKVTKLVAETFCHAVIDSGCSKTVAGRPWYEVYLESLSEKDQKNIREECSNALFKFGDSKSVQAIKKAYLPVVIGKKNVYLEVEIVESDVPLLLSKDTLTKCEAEIKYKDNSISFFGNQHEVICTESGHHAIPLNTPKDNPNEIYTVLLGQDSEMKDATPIAKKLHQQFAHPSAKRLIDLLKTSGCDNTDLFKAIEYISKVCDVCKRYKNPPPKPVVMFPLAKVFNETVALDLKVFENNKTYFLHVIDHATRFSAAAVIYSKKKEVIVDQFFKVWISIFGAPTRVLSDNGGEFSNEMFEDMCDNLNIKMMTTSAESPWSNGLCERHNAVIGEAVSKILEEVNCSIDVALCWAVNAKNTLLNVYGFSPYQLVFGHHPNLPSVLTDKLPALEGVTSSYLIANHLNALHSAREQVIKLEASEKIRRALKAKTRTHSNTHYLPRDQIYYKREDDKKWKPGEVISQSGSKVLVSTPRSGVISVHISRVRLTGEAEEKRLALDYEMDKTNLQENDQNKDESNLKQTVDTEIFTQDDDPFSDSVQANKRPESTSEHNLGEEEIVQNTQENIEQIPNDDNIERPHEVPADEQGILQEPNLIAETKSKPSVPKKNECVQYKLNENDDWVTVKILKKGGKVGGKNESYMNVRRLADDKDYGVDFSKVSDWKTVEHEVFLSSSRKDDQFETARQEELKKWKQLDVYSEVEDEGQMAITAKWVYKEKILENGTKKKARLVARGFEEQNSELLTNSPTCNQDSLRIVLSLISSLNWTVNSFDVTAAFLQGKELDRKVYLRPPKQANVPGKLWLLRKCVYGLNDASRYWYMRVREELIKLRCQCSKADPAVFYLHVNGQLEGLIVSYVDDFIWAGSENFKLNIINKVKSIFPISAEDSVTFRYVGKDIYQDSKGIYVNQLKFVDEDLQEIDVNKIKKKDYEQPLNKEEQIALRSAIGKLNWVATQTRPDISYGVSTLSSSFHHATKRHLILANKLIRQCKVSPLTLAFPKLDLQNVKVKCYSDASYGKLHDGGSQGGLYVELTSNDLVAPIAWQSKRINRVVDNVMAAEALAMKEALNTGFLVRALLSELLNRKSQDIPLEAVTDSKSLYEASYSQKSMKDRRLRIDLSIMREYILNEKCLVTWVQTDEQLADVLTKDGVDGSVIRSHISV